jgi:hypothetical protein
VELAPDLADAVDQCLFDDHVNIFQFHGHGQAVGLDVGGDTQQATLDGPQFFGADELDLGQHLAVVDEAAVGREVELLGLGDHRRHDRVGQADDLHILHLGVFGQVRPGNPPGPDAGHAQLPFLDLGQRCGGGGPRLLAHGGGTLLSGKVG